MTPEEFTERLNRLEKEFKDLYARKAPRLMGNIAVKLFKENFQKESFFGDVWKEVERRKPGGGNFKTVKRGRRKGQSVAQNAWGRRKILTGGTGDLGRSIEWKLLASGQVMILTEAVAFSGRKPYARVHNEGLRAGRGNGFIMPKRQFIGDHPTLRKAIVEGLEKALSEIKS
jgi:phage gpG-like protein